MSSGKRPAFRLTIKHNGVRSDFGVAWPTDYSGLFDVQFQVGDEAHEKFPKMDAKKALDLATQRDANGRKVAFVSLAAPKPAQGGNQSFGGGSSRRGNDDFGGGGSDPDMPFLPRNKRGPF